MTAAPAERLPTTIEFPDELHGRRVLLRPYVAEDAPALKEAVEESREALKPWMPWWNTHQSLDESIDFCIRSRARWLLRHNLNAGVWDRATGRYLGGSGFHDPDWRVPKFEIGYWLRPSAVGHGFMTEAVRVLTRAAFELLHANRVEIRCDVRNTRSRAVAERCGSVLDGTLRNDNVTTDGRLRDTLVFSLLPEEVAALLPTWGDAFPA
jgi:RimJ/RimL family protein N-acetyltransferase